MTVRDYMKLPYTRVIQEVSDEDGTRLYGKILEFDGCMTHAADYEKLRENLDEAMEGWIEMKLDGGFEVPRPQLTGAPLDQYAIYKLSI